MEISKQEFNAYRRVQYSGVTNMFDVRAVESYSGLTREQIMYIMKNYEALEKEHGDYER